MITAPSGGWLWNYANKTEGRRTHLISNTFIIKLKGLQEDSSTMHWTYIPFFIKMWVKIDHTDFKKTGF